jgi:hypothetical protein
MNPINLFPVCIGFFALCVFVRTLLFADAGQEAPRWSRVRASR